MAARPPADAADTANRRVRPGSGTVAAAGTAGGCSTMTCAFVPVTPKDDTAARRGPDVSSQSTLPVGT
nr:hypothetical protein [Actinomadura sp. CNU-125]